ncbi:MAG: glycosyltransferase family 9 protein, partial [Terriglobales bacterium]
AWAGAGRPRWVLAAGGARNPWAAMPNRRWPSSRFLALAAAARARGIALRWVGSAEDRLEPGVEDCCGRLSLRHTAAVIAASDLVIGNDSLPLVMAHALGRAALGLYGPTDARSIHAPGQPFLQGQAGCGPCYDSRHGGRGRAYRCPRARCMEQISVQHVVQEAWHA